MFGETTFTQKRNTKTGDGAGGVIETPVTLATGIPGFLNFYQRTSQDELEAEPGRRVKELKVAIFHDTTLDIRAEDALLDEATSEARRVLHVRLYDFELQADTEIIS